MNFHEKVIIPLHTYFTTKASLANSHKKSFQQQNFSYARNLRVSLLFLP